MKSTNNEPLPPMRLPSDTRLFRFTGEDEARMVIAINKAIKYMAGYGKGVQPYSRMLDASRYSGYTYQDSQKKQEELWEKKKTADTGRPA